MIDCPTKNTVYCTVLQFCLFCNWPWYWEQVYKSLAIYAVRLLAKRKRSCYNSNPSHNFTTCQLHWNTAYTVHLLVLLEKPLNHQQWFQSMSLMVLQTGLKYCKSLLVLDSTDWWNYKNEIQVSPLTRKEASMNRTSSISHQDHSLNWSGFNTERLVQLKLTLSRKLEELKLLEAGRCWIWCKRELWQNRLNIMVNLKGKWGLPFSCFTFGIIRKILVDTAQKISSQNDWPRYAPLDVVTVAKNFLFLFYCPTSVKIYIYSSNVWTP